MAVQFSKCQNETQLHSRLQPSSVPCSLRKDNELHGDLLLIEAGPACMWPVLWEPFRQTFRYLVSQSSGNGLQHEHFAVLSVFPEFLLVQSNFHLTAHFIAS